MTHEVSELLDGELPAAAADRVISRLKDDGALRETWNTYHLIGDALRGTSSVPFSQDRFVARLTDEPAIVARAVKRAELRRLPMRWAMPLAASIAAVAMVAWVAVPSITERDSPRLAAPAIPSSIITTVSTYQPQTETVAGPLAAPAITPAEDARGFEDYLLAHQRFSANSAMQGAAPYVRLVSERPVGAGR